jgi:hypothetical protein
MREPLCTTLPSGRSGAAVTQPSSNFSVSSGLLKSIANGVPGGHSLRP